MDRENLKPGIIIKGPLWPEPVKIDLVEQKGNYLKIVGSYVKTRTHVDQLLDSRQLEEVTILRDETLFNSESWKVFLAVEALRYRYASLYDPLLAVNISKVDPLPHQIEAVYGYVLKQPRIRFLIADDPGAGKTIMAGLIIKELKLRHIIRRILIVCPGHLKDQWRRELKERFDETFEVIDRNRFDSVYRTNVWEKENQVITSIDFAKKDDVLKTLAASHFDLTIVDEAHKMSAYRYGDKIDKSDRYRLGEVLSRITNHLVFLTATPHKGDPENFRLFLDLLEPGFFSTSELIQESIKNKDNPLFIRRIKEELKDFDGKPLFLPRYVTTVSFNLSDPEKELYNDLSRYVEQEYNKALQSDKKRNIAFALTILQRRLASSTYALLKSLERRKKRLEEFLKEQIDSTKEPSSILDFDEIEDMSEEEREEVEKRWESVTFATNKEELMKELKVIDNLMHKAKQVIEGEKEVKLLKLKESLNELDKHLKATEKRKILIFTESRDTLEYLQVKVKNWGYKVNTIHGGMKLEDRVNAESVFKNITDVMIATEAAGEGINLQFCNLMINFDIPWNPNRLEQRMGRIHRYGQTREVFVHNLVASDTREGKVLNKLFEKIEEIKNALGTDKVFDVLGEIIDSKQFTQALLDAAVNARSIDEILKSIDIKVDEDYINRVKENLGETLATHFIDYTRIKEMAQKAKENRLIPEYTQSFFIKAFEKAGGHIEKNDDKTFHIRSVPHEIKRIEDRESFKRSYGTILKDYPSITFDKEILRQKATVEFVSFGHPLFEAVLQWVESFASEALHQGAVFYDPDGKLDGCILFYEGEIIDGTGATAGKRIFSFFCRDREVRPVPPSILWDLKETGDADTSEIQKFDLEKLKNVAEERAIESLQKYQGELLTERKRQAEIKRKYGINSLRDLIRRLDIDLIDLEARKKKGENVDLAIFNKLERKKEYELALQELKDLIEKEQSLTMATPRYLGAICVKPLKMKDHSVMASDEEIEAIGMKVAIDHEIKENRFPEDVSSEGLGYDIRSQDKEGNVRYIEVKARAHEGDIALTQNEWFKAQRFGDDYFLYVVFNAAKNPELFIIRNPARNLNPEQKIELVRFFVKKEEIIKKREKLCTMTNVL